MMSLHFCFRLILLFSVLCVPIAWSALVETCRNYEGDAVTCPNETALANDVLKAFMKECPGRVKQSDEDVDCHFFPLVKNPETGEEESCHLYENATCMRGFILHDTRQKRRGQSGHIYITVQFVGKIQPIPIFWDDSPECIDDASATPPHCWWGEFDVSEWLAFALSHDKIMGDDLVIFCHPFMDKGPLEMGKKFLLQNDFKLDEVQKHFPDNIGIGINQLVGRTTYDAQWKFGRETGNIIANDVVFHSEPFGLNDDDVDERGFAVLECSADISTFIQLQSKSDLATGIELDMERDIEMFAMLGVGPCLHRFCFGELAPPPFGEIAKRSSVLGKHRKVHTTKEKVVLYQLIDSGAFAAFQNSNLFKITYLLTFYITVKMNI